MQNITTNHAIANTNSLNRKIANARGRMGRGRSRDPLIISLPFPSSPARFLFSSLSSLSKTQSFDRDCDFRYPLRSMKSNVALLTFLHLASKVTHRLLVAGTCPLLGSAVVPNACRCRCPYAFKPVPYQEVLAFPEWGDFHARSRFALSRSMNCGPFREWFSRAKSNIHIKM